MTKKVRVSGSHDHVGVRIGMEGEATYRPEMDGYEVLFKNFRIEFSGTIKHEDTTIFFKENQLEFL